MAARTKSTAKNKTAAAGPKAQAMSGGQQHRLSGRPINRLRLVRQMIRQCTEQMRDPNTQAKPVVAELIRLIALEKELAEETEAIREIKVTWVEPAKTEPLS